MTFLEYLNTIQHHGIKGMQWGVTTMSDDELRVAVKRMQMEKKYKTLSAERNETALTKGAKLAGNIVLKAGTQVATNYIAGQMTKAITGGFAKKSPASPTNIDGQLTAARATIAAMEAAAAAS